MAGVVLRVVEAWTATAINDAPIYVELARRFSWLDPWEASFREPGWVALLKLVCGVFGYSTGSAQLLALVVSVAGLFVAAVVVRRLLPGWPGVVVVGVLALSGRLVGEAGWGGREAVALLVCAVALLVTVERPAWLPVVGAVALAFRWELGAALLVASVLGRVGWRPLLRGAVVAVVLVGPFLWNNHRTYNDPMFHSNVHATFNRNVTLNTEWTDDPMPEGERIHPLLENPRWHGPVTSWAGFARTLGAEEVVDRESRAVAKVPAEAGEVAERWGLALVALALVGAWRRRDLLAVVAVVLLGAGVAGYGILTAFDQRLVGYLLLPLLVLVGSLTTPESRRP